MGAVVVDHIEVVDSANVARATLSRSIGPLVVTPAAAGGLVVIDTPAEFGVGSDGTAYFSVMGATPGDHARLGVDGAGNPQLVTEAI